MKLSNSLSQDSDHPQLDKPKTQSVIANVKRSQKLNHINKKRIEEKRKRHERTFATKLNDKTNNVKIKGPADK